jgi:antirestriction protein ArdC
MGIRARCTCGGPASAQAADGHHHQLAQLLQVLQGDRLEIGSAMANHAAYLGHWVELLKESPIVLLQVLSDARKAADLLCSDLPGGA